MKLNIRTHLLPTQGTNNTRDLGGYPTQSGQLTRKNVFFRSDSSSLFTDADRTLLSDLGLGLVVDLRADDEITASPSTYAGSSNIRYENVQLIDNVHTHFNPNEFPPSMGAMYIYLLDHAQNAMARIFTSFADTVNKGQSCLFHCAVGKDRTGTVAMLLLDLADVPRDIIIEDYSATYEFMKEVFDKQLADYHARGLQVPEYAFRSDASSSIETLDHLYNTYGSARNYLMECGLTKEHLDLITSSFV